MKLPDGKLLRVDGYYARDGKTYAFEYNGCGSNVLDYCSFGFFGANLKKFEPRVITGFARSISRLRTTC